MERLSHDVRQLFDLTCSRHMSRCPDQCCSLCAHAFRIRSRPPIIPTPVHPLSAAPQLAFAGDRTSSGCASAAGATVRPAEKVEEAATVSDPRRAACPDVPPELSSPAPSSGGEEFEEKYLLSDDDNDSNGHCNHPTVVGDAVLQPAVATAAAQGPDAPPSSKKRRIVPQIVYRPAEQKTANEPAPCPNPQRPTTLPPMEPAEGSAVDMAGMADNRTAMNAGAPAVGKRPASGIGHDLDEQPLAFPAKDLPRAMGHGSDILTSATTNSVGSGREDRMKATPRSGTAQGVVCRGVPSNRSGTMPNTLVRSKIKDRTMEAESHGAHAGSRQKREAVSPVPLTSLTSSSSSLLAEELRGRRHLPASRTSQTTRRVQKTIKEFFSGK